MRIYFVNPPFLPRFGRDMRWQDTGRGGTLYYPIWLSYAAGLCEREFRVRLVDAPAWGWTQGDVLEDAMKWKPDLFVIDSSFTSLHNDIAVAQTLKKIFPYVKNVIVGPPGSLLYNEILRSDGVDVVARFEYERTVRDIAVANESGANIGEVRGIAYKGDGGVVCTPVRDLAEQSDLDSFPFVSQVYKRHLRVIDYFLPYCMHPQVQIFTARGCPHECTFCSWTETLTGRKYRARSVSNVLDEFEWIQSNMPEIKEVFLEDDTFTIDRKRVIEFSKDYRKRDLELVWSANARADINLDTLRYMKWANCHFLVVGYESGSNQILKTIRKGITSERGIRFANDAKTAKLLVHGDYIVGLPGETKRTIELTKKHIERTSPELLQVSVATPFPGTQFREWVECNAFLQSEGKIYLDSKGHQSAIISYPQLSSKEIVNAVDRVLRSYYISPNYIPKFVRQVAYGQGHNEMKRILLSAVMFAKYIRTRRNSR